MLARDDEHAGREPQGYTDAFPKRAAGALHQLFYGFYSRIAVVDRTTHELARWAKDDLSDVENLPPAAEACATTPCTSA